MFCNATLDSADAQLMLFLLCVVECTPSIHGAPGHRHVEGL